MFSRQTVRGRGRESSDEVGPASIESKIKSISDKSFRTVTRALTAKRRVVRDLFLFFLFLNLRVLGKLCAANPLSSTY